MFKVDTVNVWCAYGINIFRKYMYNKPHIVSLHMYNNNKYNAL